MSEKDKMLAGELYDANYDKELIKDRYKAKDNVVIGAGSVVNKDIPSNSVAVGNPCKVIKEI